MSEDQINEFLTWAKGEGFVYKTRNEWIDPCGGVLHAKELEKLFKKNMETKIKNEEMFAPFEDWSDGDGSYFGLIMKNGKVYAPTEKEGEEGYCDDIIEWHICKNDEDNSWSVTYSSSIVCAFENYCGKIPSREFFVEVMKNISGGFDVNNV